MPRLDWLRAFRSIGLDCLELLLSAGGIVHFPLSVVYQEASNVGPVCNPVAALFVCIFDCKESSNGSQSQNYDAKTWPIDPACSSPHDPSKKDEKESAHLLHYLIVVWIYIYIPLKTIGSNP